MAMLVALCFAISATARELPTTPTENAPVTQPEVKLADWATIEQMLGKDLAKAVGIARDIWQITIIAGPDRNNPLVTVGTLRGRNRVAGAGLYRGGNDQPLGGGKAADSVTLEQKRHRAAAIADVLSCCWRCSRCCH